MDMTDMQTTDTAIEPGIYFDVPMHVYQSWPAINPSLAKVAGKSLKAFQHAKSGRRKPPSASMELGTAAHCTILEPDNLPLRYVVWKGRKQGKAFDDFERVNADKKILTLAEYEACIAMRKAVESDTCAAKYVADRMASREVCIVWLDEDTGLLCKGRIDIVGRGWIADPKTIHTLSERMIERHCCDYGYHISMAAYQAGLKTLKGEKAADLKLIFVATEAPHDVAVVTVANEALDCGRRKWANLLEQIAAAELSGNYPGIAANQELPLTLPDYELNDLGDLDIDWSESKE